MATEVAELVFRANTKDLDKATQKLNKVGKAANDATRPIGKLDSSVSQSAKSFAKWGVAIVAASAALIGMKLVSVQREFDVINSSLITVTGSTENAAIAFGQIKEFAATTPYDLAQVSNAFVKLKALGLDPSDAAMRSYGNTASAMGKDLNQMIEAVADAATGEFERLKEFGIRASSQGDDVSFTFRGITTTVKKESDSIQKYLLALGEVEFAGAMETRAATLDGAISNLGDSWDQLFLTISQSGIGELFEDTARSAGSLIDALNEVIRVKSPIEEISDELVKLAERTQDIQDKMARGMGGLRFSNELIANREASAELRLELLRLGMAAAEAYEEQRILNQAQAEAGLVADAQEAAEKKLADTKEARLDAEIGAWEIYWAEQARLSDEAAARQRAADEAGADVAQAAMEERHAGALMLEQTQMENMLGIAQAGLDMEIAAFEKAEDDKLRIAENTTNSMLAFSGMLLQGKSKDAQAAAAIAVNLLNKEKAENAKQILSDSKVAAMKAWSALSGIPIVGPVLGAAAAGTILAAGTAYAAQSLAGRALGGQVRGGESYIVGERGPEILTMGAGRGNITPNSSITNNSSPVVNKTANVSFQIVANDTAGFDELLQNRRGQIVGMINEALNNNGQEALA